MDRDEQRFGYSLALTDGDVAFSNGALQPIAGKRNLLQALSLRIQTPLGTDRFNTRYGLDVQQAFTGAHGTRMVKELIRMSLVRTLATDPRVRDVREIVFSDEPRMQALAPQTDLGAALADRRQRLWEVLVMIETIDGDTVALPVRLGV